MIKLALLLKTLFAAFIFRHCAVICAGFLRSQPAKYMANIVSTGIQQGGIEHASPEAISAGGYRFLRVFFSPGDRELLDANYERIPAGGARKHRSSGAISCPGAGGYLCPQGHGFRCFGSPGSGSAKLPGPSCTIAGFRPGANGKHGFQRAGKTWIFPCSIP